MTGTSQLTYQAVPVKTGTQFLTDAFSKAEKQLESSPSIPARPPSQTNDESDSIIAKIMEAKLKRKMMRESLASNKANSDIARAQPLAAQQVAASSMVKTQNEKIKPNRIDREDEIVYNQDSSAEQLHKHG